MIIAVNVPVVIGQQIYMTGNPLTGEKIEPPQPAIVVKEVTQADYVAYWQGAQGFEFHYALIKNNPIGRFYEIATD